MNPKTLEAPVVYPHSKLSDRPKPDLEAIKTRQQATWASGDFGQVGVRLQIVGESLCEAVDLLSTDTVLDVAAGNGNASLAAARRFADVTSTDYVPALLEEGRRRAEADQLPVKFQVADAENLPFPNGSFDVVLSTYGVMFAPNQDRAASEMLRVTKPGGRIGLANWTPDGFIGRLFDVVTEFVPPPPGLRSPMAWGTETRLVELFGPQASDIRTERKSYMFRYRSAEHWIEFFRAYYGPTLKAFAALDAEGQKGLHAALLKLLDSWARPNGGALVVPGTYLEVVVTK
ncbi:MAG TPA: class I SAM-dependent methyltransferase [Candidatus Eisenbacteria bacterium]